MTLWSWWQHYKHCPGYYHYYAPAQGALSDDVVWRLSVWRLSCTSGRRAACVARRHILADRARLGLAHGCLCALPLQAWVGAYHGAPPQLVWFWMTNCTAITNQLLNIVHSSGKTDSTGYHLFVNIIWKLAATIKLAKNISTNDTQDESHLHFAGSLYPATEQTKVTRCSENAGFKGGWFY